MPAPNNPLVGEIALHPLNLYLIAGNGPSNTMCMFVVVAENKYEAFDLYRDVKFYRKQDGSEIYHFSPYERDYLKIESTEIIPLGEAHPFVPKGVIYNLETFCDKLPDTFIVPEEPLPPQSRETNGT